MAASKLGTATCIPSGGACPIQPELLLGPDRRRGRPDLVHRCHVHRLAARPGSLAAVLSSQLSAFHSQLEVLQRYLLANSICEGLSEAERDKARAALIGETSRAQPTKEAIACWSGSSDDLDLHPAQPDSAVRALLHVSRRCGEPIAAGGAAQLHHSRAAAAAAAHCDARASSARGPCRSRPAARRRRPRSDARQRGWNCSPSIEGASRSPGAQDRAAISRERHNRPRLRDHGRTRQHRRMATWDTSIPIVYQGQRFPSRTALAEYLAPRCGKTVSTMQTLLSRYDGDVERAVAPRTLRSSARSASRGRRFRAARRWRSISRCATIDPPSRSRAC